MKNNHSRKVNSTMRYLYCLLAALLPFTAMAQQGGDSWLAQMQQEGDAWLAQMQNYLQQNPETPGLEPFLKAMETFDNPASQANMGEVLSNGWQRPYPDLVQAIRQNRDALASAKKAGEEGPIPWPTNDSVPSMDLDRSPVMVMMKAHDLANMMGCVSHYGLYQGNAEFAAEWGVAVVRFSESIQHHAPDPTQAMTGIAKIAVGTNVLEEVLASPSLTPVLARKIGSAIHEVDQRFRWKEIYSEGLRAHIVKLRSAGNEFGIPEENVVEEGLKALSSAFDRPGAVTHEDLARVFGIPVEWCRENLVDPQTYRTLSLYALTKLRLLQGLAAKKMGQPALVRSFMDPFSGEPLLIATDGALYSIGPDGVDQGGKQEYEPADGDSAPGDIIVGR